MKLLFSAVAILTLAACATPVGQIPESEFTWETQKLDVSYQAVYRNLRDGFAKCAGMIAQGDLYTDIGEGRMTAYLQGAVTQRQTAFVVGTITVSGRPAERGSELKMGVLTKYDQPVFVASGQIRARWARWARGDFNCD